MIPGLVDLHVHFSGNPLPNGEREDFDLHQTARRMLYCGVTAFLDLATNEPDKFFAARDQQRADLAASADEADIHGAGAAFGKWNLESAATSTPLKASS